jgi:hypothetical protein
VCFLLVLPTTTTQPREEREREREREKETEPKMKRDDMRKNVQKMGPSSLHKKKEGLLIK